jgi:hypothetical protein
MKTCSGALSLLLVPLPLSARLGLAEFELVLRTETVAVSDCVAPGANSSVMPSD